MAGEVIVDALPYIDQGYDEAGVREAALAMVEEETRRYRPTKNYLETLPPLNLSQFETEMMRGEWERMQQRQPMDVLSMKRYELPPPPAGKMADVAAWTECAENSMAQLEHQATRICNLELMLEFGCEAWKSYLEVLVASVSQAQKNLQTLRKDIQEINWERKNAQMKGGEKLRELEATWVSLVSKNYDIEQACVQLEEEIIHLQWVKEHAAKRRRGDEDRSSKRAKREQDREREREREREKEREKEIERDLEREREYQKEVEQEELRVQQEQLQREEELRQLEERERERLAAQQLEVEQESVGNIHNDDDGQKREAENCGGEEVEENESEKDQTSQQGDVSNDDDSNSYSSFSYSNSTSHGAENEDEDSREQARSEKDNVDSNE